MRIVLVRKGINGYLQCAVRRGQREYSTRVQRSKAAKTVLPRQTPVEINHVKQENAAEALKVNGLPVWSETTVYKNEEALLLDAAPLLWSLAYRGVSQPQEIVTRLDKACKMVIGKRKPTYAALVLDSPGARQSKQKVIEQFREQVIVERQTAQIQVSKSKGESDQTKDVQPLLKDEKEKSAIIDISVSNLNFEYKGNRVATNIGDLIKEVFAILTKPSTHMFTSMAVIHSPETEADDIIATLTRMALDFSPSTSVVIASTDKDYFQLLTDSRVSIMRAPRAFFTGKMDVSREWVCQNIGVHPEQFVDYLAMTGDAADNVPGIKGIGPIRAQKLLSDFQTLDKILAISQKRSGQNAMWREIANSGDIARLSREVVRLNQQVPIKLPNGFKSWKEAIRLPLSNS